MGSRRGEVDGDVRRQILLVRSLIARPLRPSLPINIWDGIKLVPSIVLVDVFCPPGVRLKMKRIPPMMIVATSAKKINMASIKKRSILCFNARFEWASWSCMQLVSATLCKTGHKTLWLMTSNAKKQQVRNHLMGKDPTLPNPRKSFRYHQPPVRKNPSSSVEGMGWIQVKVDLDVAITENKRQKISMSSSAYTYTCRSEMRNSLWVFILNFIPGKLGVMENMWWLLKGFSGLMGM